MNAFLVYSTQSVIMLLLMADWGNAEIRDCKATRADDRIWGLGLMS